MILYSPAGGFDVCFWTTDTVPRMSTGLVDPVSERLSRRSGVGRTRFQRLSAYLCV